MTPLLPLPESTPMSTTKWQYLRLIKRTIGHAIFASSPGSVRAELQEALGNLGSPGHVVLEGSTIECKVTVYFTDLLDALGTCGWNLIGEIDRELYSRREC